MNAARIAADATKTKWEGRTREVRELARDVLAILAHADRLEDALAAVIRDLEQLAEKWEKAAEDAAQHKYGPDLVSASDAAETCARRVREVIALATFERCAACPFPDDRDHCCHDQEQP